MNKCNFIKNNSVGTIDKTNLSEQTKFWLDEISKIEKYFLKNKFIKKIMQSKIK